MKHTKLQKGNDYWLWDKEIPHEICQKIINSGEDIRSKNSDIVWVEHQWVYDLIWPYMLRANEQAGWKYNIIAAEDCQRTQYTKDGFYTWSWTKSSSLDYINWHRDGTGSHREVHNKPDSEFLHNNARKLSMSIVLNSDFEGGDFEIRGVADENKVPRLEEGSIIVFPSFMEHRVVPVTKGIRYSLVAWFVGPPFV